MTAAYKTVSAATLGTEIITAPTAKNRRVVRSLYINSSAQLKIVLISGYMNEVQSVYHNATGGTFTLTYSSQTTASIAYNANAALMVTRITGMNNVTDVTVTGTGTPSDPWIVTFVDPGGADIDLMTLDPASLTGVVTTIATVTPGVDAVNEIQSVFNGAAGGTFTLTFDAAVTGDLAYNISASDLKIALEGLSTITTVTTSGTGVSGAPWLVTFTDPGAQDVSMLVADDTELTGGDPNSTIAEDTAGVANVDEVQSVYNNAGSGTFTLTYSTQTTDATVFDANAALIKTRLEALNNVTTVAVTGAGTSADKWIITFSDPAGAIDEMTATDTSLVEVNVVTEDTPGAAGTEKFVVYLAADGIVDLAYNPSDEGHFECGSAESLSFTTSGSGNVTVLLGYDTVGGS